jgi:hypothetical protein
MADPARVELHFLPRLAIEDRDHRCRLAKLQLEDREAVQRRIRNVDALPDQQLANLRETQSVTEPALDRGAMLAADVPAIATRPTTRGASAGRPRR